MFGTLADAGVNIEMISTSEVRITCMIAEDELETALRALHDAFELERPEPIEVARGRLSRRRRRAHAAVPRSPGALRRRRLDQRRRARLAAPTARPRSASPSPTSRPPVAAAKVGPGRRRPAPRCCCRSGSGRPGSRPARSGAWPRRVSLAMAEAAEAIAGLPDGRDPPQVAERPGRRDRAADRCDPRRDARGSASSPASSARPTGWDGPRPARRHRHRREHGLGRARHSHRTSRPR